MIQTTVQKNKAIVLEAFDTLFNSGTATGLFVNCGLLHDFDHLIKSLPLDTN